MRIPRPPAGVLVAALLIFMLGGGIYLRVRGPEEARAEPRSGEVLPEVSATSAFDTGVPIPVEGTPAVRDTLVISVKAAGQAVAARRTVILAQVSGRVVAIPVKESQAVAAGTPLIRLDPAEYQLAVDEASANLRKAEAEYRSQTLFDDRIADEEERGERARNARARSGFDAAEVALQRALMNLERTRVSAPFAGRVADLRVVEGQWVQAGTELLEVADLDPIRVDVHVLETEVPSLAPGRPAAVTFAAYPNEVFRGRILTVNPRVEQDTRTARVSVEVANPGGRILPGMYAHVALDALRFPDRVLVPRSAILERDHTRANRGSMVFVYEGDERQGRAKWRYVTTGMENDSLVEIVPDPDTEMVEPGEVVLTNGHHTLIHDAAIRVVESVRTESEGRPQ